MLTLSRGAMSAAVAGVLLMGGVFAACGLDESGLVGSDASVFPEAGGDVLILPDVDIDNYIPPPDAAIDASCFDAEVPDGWLAVGIKAGTVTCPGQPGDYLAKQYVKDPTLDSNSCACGGCAPTGTWSCTGTLYSGPSCGTTTSVNGAGCSAVYAFHYGATVQTSGNASCAAAQQTGTGDASATPIGACIPQTTQADFCGLAAQSFDLCILNTSVTDGGCPSGFSNATIAGVQALAACDTCSCTLANADAGCTGSVTAFNNNNCADGGFVATQPADGTCTNTNGYSSLYFAPDPPPAPSCTPSTAGGLPILGGALTICCP
ncbi:MAG TPA: hypothetical protein VLM85_13715 [Polyangiaceae bacterium]|nr:hypothetical protein [Polyangiaceae bacterium]